MFAPSDATFPHRMPEGLVKISQALYDSILPLVKTQVESQVLMQFLQSNDLR